mgnify:CR=1 FL=1
MAQEVAKEVRTYIDRGIDFLKYGANEHGAQSLGAFLSFSERVQRAIVDEAHDAGITAQAHIMSVEGLHTAVAAGCDLITHCNITGPVEIPAETIELMVQDTGAGMSKEHVERTFTPFFTTKEKGSGLGLALVRKFARDHGGEATLESEPGRGTTVRMVLAPSRAEEAATTNEGGPDEASVREDEEPALLG